MSRGAGAGSEAFEAAVERAFGARLRSDEAACCAMWSALANVEWKHAGGAAVDHSFRRASEVVATIRGKGHVLEWHCCGPAGAVSDEIRAAMAREGWTHGPITT